MLVTLKSVQAVKPGLKVSDTSPMRALKLILLVGVLTVVNLARPSALADTGQKLPLVYDPQTKKYFIGGTSRFVLKQGESSSLIDRIEVSIDGGEYIPYGAAIEFKEEGKHTLKFRAVNPVNNWSPVQFVEVFVDLTPATTEAKFSELNYFKDEGGIYVGLNSLITLASQDNLSGIASLEYSWDGSNYSPYTKPIAVEKNGRQTLFFRSVDKVGNAEPVKQIGFVVDGTAPASDLKLVGGLGRPAVVNGRNYVSDSVAFNLTAQDDASKLKQVWVQVDGAKPQAYIKPLYFLQEGPHTLAYYSEDNVGNRETMKTMSFYTVSAAPKAMAQVIGKVINTGGINYARRDFALKLEAQDNVVGLERIEFKTEADGEFKTYLEPIRFTTPGYHSVTYRSVDRAGNIEPAKTYSVTITEAAPETTLATAQPLVVREGVTYSPAPNVLTFNVSNSAVGVAKTLYSINDGQWVPYTGPLTLGTEQRIYKIAYKSLDKLENEETPKNSTFHMIGMSPVVDLFISSGRSNEEVVRTNYLDQPGTAKNAGDGAAARGVASEKKKK